MSFERSLSSIVAVLVHDTEIAGAKPASGEGGAGGVRVFQIALHENVSAHHYLAHGGAVRRRFSQRLRVHHREVVKYRIAHALAGLERCPLVGRQAIPPPPATRRPRRARNIR